MIGINAEEIKGFDTLKVSQNMFKRFLENFLNAWEEDVRETIVPIKVGVSKGYLRFDYEIDGTKEWLHVTGPNTWY